jgi:hypothetical protein
MALLKCDDCGHDVSDAAAACPHCGRPTKAALKQTISEANVDVSVGLMQMTIGIGLIVFVGLVLAWAFH